MNSKAPSFVFLGFELAYQPEVERSAALGTASAFAVGESGGAAVDGECAVVVVEEEAFCVGETVVWGEAAAGAEAAAADAEAAVAEAAAVCGEAAAVDEEAVAAEEAADVVVCTGG